MSTGIMAGLILVAANTDGIKKLTNPLPEARRKSAQVIVSNEDDFESRLLRILAAMKSCDEVRIVIHLPSYSEMTDFASFALSKIPTKRSGLQVILVGSAHDATVKRAAAGAGAEVMSYERYRGRPEAALSPSAPR